MVVRLATSAAGNAAPCTSSSESVTSEPGHGGHVHCARMAPRRLDDLPDDDIDIPFMEEHDPDIDIPGIDDDEEAAGEDAEGPE